MYLTVHVISDVVCPWCYIGKRRLEKAITAYGGPVKVRWLPYQLNPTMPKEGISRREYRTKKFGSWERSQELDARVIAVGKEEGIDFSFDRIERTPNTLDAHRLIWLADKEGVQDAVVESLFLAYFTNGRDISDSVLPGNSAVSLAIRPKHKPSLLIRNAGCRPSPVIGMKHDLIVCQWTTAMDQNASYSDRLFDRC